MTNIIPSKQRKTFVGIVSSDKNDKTITVVVETSKRHPMYHKSFKSTKKYHAHDETNQAKIGDKVEIISTRPLSALKRFRLLKIIEFKTNKKA
ncbi:30S ribosomal protein S17 [Spiroplasma endosymbiont of Lasioglossum malachurum]|uniref:30S ribosomal protein S17 n=1 Tax=Spiroplasma endosymbiont of Lasioglossum malachurum TaxID=3066319 RepID=UPI0030CDFDAC